MISLEQLQRVCPGAHPARLELVLPALNHSLAHADLLTPDRSAMYLAQLAHESCEFRRTEEDLFYSAEGIVKVWRHRFATVLDSGPYAHQPERLANKVYADRMGNGDERSGDGWKYRGRGWIMLTGYDNYRRCGLFLGVDLATSPELLLSAQYAALSSAWFWRSNGLNRFADRHDIEGCTRVINKGLDGLDERREHYLRALDAFGLTLGVA